MRPFTVFNEGITRSAGAHNCFPLPRQPIFSGPILCRTLSPFFYGNELCSLQIFRKVQKNFLIG